MALEFQNKVVELAVSVTGARIVGTPSWLNRPGRAECGPIWEDVQSIYHKLTDLALPDVMPTRERRTVDAVFEYPDGSRQILEVDEKQHFNEFRALTLRTYPEAPVAFDRDAWLETSDRKVRLEGGGFAAPKPPLFPGQNGRHRQRAFRDALCDLLPPVHGFHPTARIAYFEDSAGLGHLLETRLIGSGVGAYPVEVDERSLPPESVARDRGTARTQRITENDLKSGQIRLPHSTKSLLPPSDSTVVIVLRGWESSASWRPRYGPDRERSGILRIGRQELSRRVAADEVLTVSIDELDRVLLD